MNYYVERIYEYIENPNVKILDIMIFSKKELGERITLWIEEKHKEGRCYWMFRKKAETLLMNNIHIAKEQEREYQERLAEFHNDRADFNKLRHEIAAEWRKGESL